MGHRVLANPGRLTPPYSDRAGGGGPHSALSPSLTPLSASTSPLLPPSLPLCCHVPAHVPPSLPSFPALSGPHSHSCLSASAVGCPARPCTGENPSSSSKEEPVLHTARAALPVAALTFLSVSVHLHVPNPQAQPVGRHVLPCLRFLPGPSTSSRLRGTAPCTTLSCSTGSPRTERRST